MEMSARTHESRFNHLKKKKKKERKKSRRKGQRKINDKKTRKKIGGRKFVRRSNPVMALSLLLVVPVC